MFMPNFVEKTVQSVKPGTVNKGTYVVTLVSPGGSRSACQYSKQKMEELMEKLGISSTEELKGRNAIIRDKNKIAYLPKGAEITIAAKGADGEFIKLDFEDI